jgi:ParB family chromosome partitioning protein
MNDTVNPPISGPVFLIEVTQIKPNPNQPRRDFNEEQLRELANSIREFGVLQPIIVTKIERETPTGTEVEYLLIAGERRLMASKLAGLERIPAIIRNVSLDKERLELAIVENIQRVNLNPIESARAYSRLQDEFKLTQREIASRLGKSREVIANSMRLLGLPQAIQDAVAEGKLSESQARLLLMIEDIPKQQALFEEIIRNNLSVREVKSKIAILKNEAEKAISQAGDTAPVDPETIALQRELEEALGAKVKVEKAGASGKITINFHSAEEMYGLVQRLKEKHGSIPPGFAL